MDKAKIQHEIKQKKRIVTVIGTIEDVRILGEGGNGLVYKGKLYGIDVAVKLLVNTDHKKRERFILIFRPLATQNISARTWNTMKLIFLVKKFHA